jgi:hypothetical protein
MKRNVNVWASFFGAIVAAIAAEAHAQEAVDERRLTELLHPYYLSEAARYEFSLDGTASTRLKLVRTPVMSWTGHEQGGLSSGDVFVWTHNGRAELIGCIGSLPRDDSLRMVFHEFHALSVDPLPAVQVANEEWKPEKPGVELTQVKDAPLPAARREQRLAQMRSIARDFGARMQSPTGEEELLRMLPQPIYRYVSKNNDPDDMAVFAFVWSVGTDPELLLLIESRKTDEGYRWHFAPVRFNYRDLALDHRGIEVWNVGRHGNRPGEPYVTRWASSVTVPDLQKQEEAIKNTASDN